MLVDLNFDGIFKVPNSNILYHIFIIIELYFNYWSRAVEYGIYGGHRKIKINLLLNIVK